MLYGYAGPLQKFKEIGIRKVLGASSLSLVSLQVREFIKLVLIAFIVSVPLAYASMDKWLEGFPLKENIHPLIFIISGLAAIIIAWLTVSYQSIKAARINPVDSITHE